MFLNYYGGAMPNKKPPKKPEEKKTTQKLYEASRTRTFQESWKKDRPWLEFDHDKGTMSCSVC